MTALSQNLQNSQHTTETSPKLDCLRQSRRNQRSEFYAEILTLRETGPSPRQIEPRTGLNIRTVKRWLPASGEPEHRRPPSRSVLMGRFRDYLEKGSDEGQHNRLQLWTETKHRGFEGRTAARKERSSTASRRHRAGIVHSPQRRPDVSR